VTRTFVCVDESVQCTLSVQFEVARDLVDETLGRRPDREHGARARGDLRPAGVTNYARYKALLARLALQRHTEVAEKRVLCSGTGISWDG